MSTFHRRYIFIDFDNLKEVKFKKLQKVCDKVFIFINSDEKNIPLDLALYLQRMGKAVKWVLVEPTEEGNMNYVMSFMMGRLHQKVEKSVEFAVLSNDPEFDTVVSFMNNSNNRSCLRVKREKLEIERNPSPPVYQAEKEDYSSIIKSSAPIKKNSSFPATQYVSFSREEKVAVEEGAENTINRLMRSGNRPSKVELLKEYIMTVNPGTIYSTNSADKVITKLTESQEIEVMEEDVIYHF